ncbi:ATP-binding protein [Saccharothrix isguenensis]
MSTGNDTVVLVMDDRGSPPRGEVELWLRDRMDDWRGHEALLVGVVVGELLDNAWRYGEPPYVLELVLDRWIETLTIRVRNRAPAQNQSAGWPLGAGLLVVEALTEQWGVVSLAEHTTVWAKVWFED